MVLDGMRCLTGSSCIFAGSVKSCSEFSKGLDAAVARNVIVGSCFPREAGQVAKHRKLAQPYGQTGFGQITSIWNLEKPILKTLELVYMLLNGWACVLKYFGKEWMGLHD